MAASICQIALSAVDGRRTQAWYRDVLGLLPASGASMGGERLAQIQGLPEAEAEVLWLCDRQYFFQLEIFEYARPAPRPLLPDRRPNDIGYTTIGIHVDDLDGALERAAAAGSPPLTEPLGEAGERRACVRDPDGVLVELMEDDPRERGTDRRVRDAASVVRSVTASVRSIDAARRFWVDAVGLAQASAPLHGMEHERLWGLDGATRKAHVLWGNDVALELVEYVDPRGRDWPAGYRISDQGIVNVAVGGPDGEAWERAVELTRAGGYHHNVLTEFPGVRVVYVDDDQGFSVELLHNSSDNLARGGWEPE